RAARATHRPSPPPLRGGRFFHQRRKGRVERPPRPLAALSPSPHSRAYRSRAYPLAALAPSPRLRGEGGGEGPLAMLRLADVPPPPPRLPPPPPPPPPGAGRPAPPP